MGCSALSIQVEASEPFPCALRSRKRGESACESPKNPPEENDEDREADGQESGHSAASDNRWNRSKNNGGAAHDQQEIILDRPARLSGEPGSAAALPQKVKDQRQHQGQSGDARDLDQRSSVEASPDPDDPEHSQQDAEDQRGLAEGA